MHVNIIVLTVADLFMLFSLIFNVLSFLEKAKAKTTGNKKEYFKFFEFFASTVFLFLSLYSADAFTSPTEKAFLILFIGLSIINAAFFIHNTLLTGLTGIPKTVKTAVLITLSLTAIGGISYPVWTSARVTDATPVIFKDRRLENFVRDTLDVSVSDEIFAVQLKDITELSIFGDLAVMGECVANNQNVGSNTFTHNGETYDTTDVVNLSDLLYFTNLEQLSVVNNNVEGLDAIASLKKLELLSLVNCNIENIGFLKNATGLRTLYLWNNPNLKSLNEIEKCENLRTLSIGNTGIEDLAVLTAFKRLSFFNANSNYINDILQLQTCTGLTELNLTQCTINNLGQIGEMFKNLPNLDEVYLGSTGISDIEFLTANTNIETLYLNDNSISDISPLLQLEKLEEVNLQNNIFESVNLLADARKDITFYVANNKNLKDWNAVKTYENIKGLPLISNVTYKKPVALNFANDQKTIRINGTRVEDNVLNVYQDDDGYWMPLDIIINAFGFDLNENNTGDLSELTITPLDADEKGLEINVNLTENTATVPYLSYMSGSAFTVPREIYTNDMHRLLNGERYVSIPFITNVLGLEVSQMTFAAAGYPTVTVTNKYYSKPYVEITHEENYIDVNLVMPYGFGWANFYYDDLEDGVEGWSDPIELSDVIAAIQVSIKKGKVWVNAQDANGAFINYKGNAYFTEELDYLPEEITPAPIDL